MPEEKPPAYRGMECGECGDPITPGEWCGNEECPLGNYTPEYSDTDGLE
jgi:hypothetical protein